MSDTPPARLTTLGSSWDSRWWRAPKSFFQPTPMSLVSPSRSHRIRYPGLPRGGLLATCRRGDLTYEISLADVVFPAASAGASLVGRYRMWLGLAPFVSPGAEVARPHKVEGDDIVVGLPIDLVVLACKSNALRCRLLGSVREVTLRTAVRDEILGSIITVTPKKQWTHARHPYLSGEVSSVRIDASVLGLVPLALEREDAPHDVAGRGAGGGGRPTYRLAQVTPGDPASDLLLEGARGPEGVQAILRRQARGASHQHGRTCAARPRQRYRGARGRRAEPGLAGRTISDARLMRGDLRPAYLAWLLAVSADDLDGDAEEPPVPAGLAELTAAQEAMVEFLRIDVDLVAAAASGSAAVAEDGAPVRRWLRAMSVKEKDAWLRRAVDEPDLALGDELLRAFRAASTSEHSRTRRTVGELRVLAEAQRTARETAEAARAKKAKAAANAARQRNLTKLARDVEGAWSRLEKLVETSDYDVALKLAVDLRDLAIRDVKAPAFARRFESLRRRQLRRRGFFDRWKRANAHELGSW